MLPLRCRTLAALAAALLLLLAHAPDARSAFDPPKDLVIERTWSMIVYGEVVGMIRATRDVRTTGGRPLIRYHMNSMVGVEQGKQINSQETVWIGPAGMEIYKGVFKETGQEAAIHLDGRLTGDTLKMDIRMAPDQPAYPVSFVRNVDYHWSTAYMDFERMNFQKGVQLKRKILDIYSVESKDVTATLLGTETVKQGGRSIRCNKIKFDYGDVKGIFWMATDELGHFLVKEEAESHGVPFKLVLDEYRKETAGKRKKPEPKKDFGF